MMMWILHGLTLLFAVEVAPFAVAPADKKTHDMGEAQTG